MSRFFGPIVFQINEVLQKFEKLFHKNRQRSTEVLTGLETFLDSV